MLQTQKFNCLQHIFEKSTKAYLFVQLYPDNIHTMDRTVDNNIRYKLQKQNE